jgi:hypothetical protein
MTITSAKSETTDDAITIERRARAVSLDHCKRRPGGGASLRKA